MRDADYSARKGNIASKVLAWLAISVLFLSIALVIAMLVRGIVWVVTGA